MAGSQKAPNSFHHNPCIKSLVWCGSARHEGNIYHPCSQAPKRGTTARNFFLIKKKVALLPEPVRHWHHEPFIPLTHCYNSTLHSLAVRRCWCKMWQPFPEHTRNLTTAPRRVISNRSASVPTTKPRTLYSSCVSVVTVFPFMDICRDPEITEKGAIWHLAAPAKTQRCRPGRGVGGSALPEKELGLGLHAFWASSCSQVSWALGRSWCRARGALGLTPASGTTGEEPGRNWKKFRVWASFQPRARRVTACRNWGTWLCSFRSKPGFLKHYFLKCPWARGLWRARHFQKKSQNRCLFPWDLKPDVCRQLLASSSLSPNSFPASSFHSCHSSPVELLLQEDGQLGGHILPGPPPRLLQSPLQKRAKAASLDTAPPQPDRLWIAWGSCWNAHSHSEDLGWRLSCCFLDTLSGDAEAAGLQTVPWVTQL